MAFGAVGCRSYERTHCLVPLQTTDPERPGEPLCLGHKWTVKTFDVSDDGYVIRPIEDNGHFGQLPTDAELRECQRSGLLPAQFPTYSIPITAYFRPAFRFAFAIIAGLWLLVFLFSNFDKIRRILGRSKEAPEKGSSPSAPAMEFLLISNSRFLREFPGWTRDRDAGTSRVRRRPTSRYVSSRRSWSRPLPA